MNSRYLHVLASFFSAACLLVSAVSEAQILSLSPSRTVGPVWGLDFSPNGAFLAAAGGQRNAQGVVQIWDTRDWSEIYSVNEPRAATCVAFSSDNRRIAIGLQNGEVVIADVSKKQIEKRWPTGSWAVFGMTWLPDGKQAVSTCAGGTIKIWNADNGTLKRVLDIWEAHGTVDPKLRGNDASNMWDADASSDGRRLFSAGWNDTARVWNLDDGELLHCFLETDLSTQGIMLTPDEAFFVSTSIYGSSHVRDTKNFRVRATLPSVGRDIAVHPNGNWIAVGTSQSIDVFKLHLTMPPVSESSRIKKLIVQLGDSNIQIREAASTELRRIGRPAEPFVFEALDSADSETRVQARSIWDARDTYAPDVSIPESKGEVRQLIFSPDGKYLASTAGSGEVQIWDTVDFKLQRTLEVLLPK